MTYEIKGLGVWNSIFILHFKCSQAWINMKGFVLKSIRCALRSQNRIPKQQTINKVVFLNEIMRKGLLASKEFGLDCWTLA